MTDIRDETEQDLRIELMKVQIDRVRQEMRWEVYKALAAILGAAAAIAGASVGLGVWFSHWH
jgi:hypothetical protein